MSLITLTTDFGTRDWFVGAMKGVILGINPRARIVDLTHGIPAGDIPAGAFALAAGAPCFPSGTIHVGVVDPGVGGPRPAVAVRTDRFIFVGPDNGLLSAALAGERVRGVRRLENRKLFRATVSRTFHGRDIFAPVSAHLSNGIPFSRIGPRAGDLETLAWPEPCAVAGEVRGRILHIDRFGNAITNIPERLIPARGEWFVRVRGRRRITPASFYAAVPVGQPVAVIGSTGFLEIAVNRGSAAAVLNLHPNGPCTVVPGRTPGPGARPKRPSTHRQPRR